MTVRTLPSFEAATRRRWPSVGFLLSALGLLLLFSGVAYLRQAASQSELRYAISNPIHPRYISGPFVIYCIYCLIGQVPNKVGRRLPIPLMISCIAFAMCTLVEGIVNVNYDTPAFEYRIEFMIMVPVYIFVFSRVAEIRSIFSLVRIIVLLECLLHVVVFLRPRSFPLFEEFGRVSGLWGNSNAAGFFIAGALPLAIIGAGPRSRIAIYCATFIGALVTLSRGTMILWVVLCALTAVFGRGNKAGRLFFLSTAGLGAAFGSAIASSGLVDWFASASGNLSARLSTLSDASATERMYVVKLAWEKFLNKPVLGNGIGFTYHWDYSAASTHNMFLLILAEQGIFGFVFMILWILSLLSIGGLAGLVAVAFFCTAGLFSHNIFESEYAILFALYWLAGCLEKAPLDDGGAPSTPSHPALPDSAMEMRWSPVT